MFAHVLAPTVKILTGWVHFDLVPKDTVDSNCSILCQKKKIGLCFTEGARLSFWSVYPVEVEAYITGTVGFQNSEKVRNISRRKENEYVPCHVCVS